MRKNIQKFLTKLTFAPNKTVIITGGNSGIGFEASKLFASLKYKIILAVRNMQKGKDAQEEIIKEYPDAEVEIMQLDLMSLDSINDFVISLINKKVDIDIFYNNAGIYRMPYSKAYLSLESMCATNFVSNYILFSKLREYFVSLKHPVKFLLTTSITARRRKFDKEDFYGINHFGKYKNYGKSKVGVNKLFLYIKDETKGTNIIPILVHPGITYTPLINKAYQGRKFILSAQIFMRMFFHKSDKACLGALLASSNNIKDAVLIGPNSIFHLSGYPKVYKLYKGNIKDYKLTMSQLQEITKNV